MENIVRLVIFLAFVCQNGYAQITGFVLNGRIEGIKDGASIYLVSNRNDTLYKGKSTMENFEFTGTIEGKADYYFLKIDSAKGESNPLWLTNNKMTVYGKLSDFKSLVLLGSKPQLEYTMFENILKLTKGNDVRFRELTKILSSANSDSYFAPYIMSANSYFFRLNDLADIYDKLNDTIKASRYGIELKKRIDTEKVKGLGNLPNFRITDVEGNISSILQIASQSEYTLIDFWASWCAPCRAAVPKLKEVFEAYHPKGFNIVGISTDKSKSSWKKAVEEDKTPWMHRLDNVDIASKNIFNLIAIPGYILVDRNGRIIHTDLIDGVSPPKTTKDKKLSTDLEEILNNLLSKPNDNKHEKLNYEN